MTRNIRQVISLLGILTVASPSLALLAAEAAQWPAGPNVCQGIWSYSEYQSCEDATHGQDFNRPIVSTDGERCGYEKMQNSCWHGREYEGYFDMEQDRMNRRTPFADAELQAHCDSKGRALPMAGHQLLGPVSVVNLTRGTVCPSGGQGPCDGRLFIATFQCRIVIDHQIFGSANECGPYIDDVTRPKTCVVGYPNINKRSPACASSNLSTGRGTDAKELMSADWRYNFSCSTGDELAAETADQVQKKYVFLVNRLQETLDSSSPDFTPLMNGLAALLEKRSSFLSGEQKAYATKVTNSEIKLSKTTEGPAFDVAKECVSAGSEKSRFCPNKRMVFDFGDISHFPNISPYTSVAHKLNYSFPCAANNKQLSIRLIEGDDEFLLAPTAGSTAQSTSVVFRLGSRPPQLEILPDRNALLPYSCNLNIQYSSLDLDPTLLLSSSNALIGKVRMLADFKTRLNSESQLPERYKTVQFLKDRLNDQIMEDTFKCQDLAATEADNLCPLNDEPARACKATVPLLSGEIGFILDRIKQNSCLYSDLEQGLPATVPCVSDGINGLCLEGVKKAAEKAEVEYQKSRGAAERLMNALSIEKTRIGARQIDLARKIGLVIDAIKKGLNDTPNPSIPPAGEETNTPEVPGTLKVIYDGESAPFSFGQGWDLRQSTVTESSAAPASGTKHLGFTINNENFWGAAAYPWANFAAIDLSKYRQLTFKAKATDDITIKAFLVAIETNSESTYIDLTVGKTYKTFVIDLQKLKADGFDLSLPQGLVIATSSDGKASYTVDIDDLKAIP